MKRNSRTKSIKSEKDLRRPVARFLEARAFPLQKREVPFYEYRMDVYAYSPHQHVTVAIELKIAKWNRAVEQALLYQLCSDLVYIALPSRAAIRVDRALLEECGLGLLEIDSTSNCTELIAPRISSVIRDHYKQQYIEGLWNKKQTSGLLRL